jgi:hypothetical protein
MTLKSMRLELNGPALFIGSLLRSRAKHTARSTSNAGGCPAWTVEGAVLDDANHGVDERGGASCVALQRGAA